MLKIFRNLILAVVVLAFALGNTATTAGNPAKANAKEKKKIVFIAGRDSHGRGEHEFRAGSHLLAKLLNQTRSDINAVVTEDGWPKNTSILDDADVIVMYSDGGDGHMANPHLAELDKLAKKGIGLVAMHYAVEVPAGEPGNYFTKWFGGYFEAWYSVNPFFVPELEKLPKSAVSSGVKPFQVRDEWYYHLRFANDKKITPVLTTHPPLTTLAAQMSIRGNNEFVKKDLEDGKLQTLAWTYERPDGGRSFGFTGGHSHTNWANDDFRKLVLNAIVWTAKLKVPKEGVVTPTPNAADLEYLLKAPRPARAVPAVVKPVETTPAK